MTLKGCSAILFFLVFLAAGAPGVPAQEDVAEKRSKMMKGISAENKAIKSAVGKKNYGTIASKARKIADTLEMKTFAAYFPHNSTSEESRARADIWTNWDDFMSKAYDGRQKALALAEAADAKDAAKVSAAYKDYGKVCGSCHKPFRAPKKK